MDNGNRVYPALRLVQVMSEPESWQKFIIIIQDTGKRF